MNKKEIKEYLTELNERLKNRGIKGQIGLYGGTVMCLAFDARSSTKDIDAIFEPKKIIYDIAGQMAEEHNLPVDWLNDSVKGFVRPNNEMRVFMNMSNLTVYVPSPEYMLAMKCMSARLTGATDEDDIVFLIKYLNIIDVDQVIGIILKYFPENMIMPKTQYFLMELLRERNKGNKE